MAEETKGSGGFVALFLLAAAAVGAYFYVQVPKATITVYADGTIDASLGNEKINDKGWNVNGVIELKTWNGYLLQIFIPTTVVRKGETFTIVDGNIGYQLSKLGNILSSGVNMTASKSDNYITVTFA